MPRKKIILLLYGGKSVEHEVSIRSARNVFEKTDRSLFDVIAVGIDKDGIWQLNERIEGSVQKGDRVMPIPSVDRPKLLDIDSGEVFNYDVVFPVLHGTGGEDGSIQGLFKSLNAPLVGCNVLGSAVAMDKIVSKYMLKSAGIPVARFEHYHIMQLDEINYNKVCDHLGKPFMMKAGALGSSVGVFKIKNREEFESSLNKCFSYGKRVLFEECIAGREMECGVVGNNHPKATAPGEIILKKNYDFYTYQAKYQDEDAIDIVIPAKVGEDIAEKVKHECIRAFLALQCDDYARVDLFLKDNGEVIINEVNTIPGFTNVSMFSMLWENEGVSYQELITKLIGLALSRWEKESLYETHYDQA